MIKKEIYLIIFIVFFGMATGCSKNLMPPEAQSVSIASGIGEKELDSSGNEIIASGPKENSDSSGESLGQSDKVPFSGRPFEEKPHQYGICAGDCMVSHFAPEAPRREAPRRQNYTQEARRQNYKETNDIQDIIFKFDRYDLDDESRAVLRNNVTYLKKNSMTSIEIQGHCDERGTNNYNIALGERRAQATKVYMVSQGISASRIHTISYGEEKPFCFDSNDACWLKNRRAHFKVDR